MKKLFALCLALLLSALPGRAAYRADSPERPVVCCEGKTGCLVLQMVMLGSFAEFDPGDSLNGRVLSAALPSLCAVTDEETTHFCKEFDADAEDLRRCYYIALGNCLWADILFGDAVDPETKAMHRVLLLFLDPAGEENALEQMAVIRSQIDDGLISRMAEATGAPVDFIESLIFNGFEDGSSLPPEE